MKNKVNALLHKSLPDNLTENSISKSTDSQYQKLELQIQKYEQDIRNHIKVFKLVLMIDRVITEIVCRIHTTATLGIGVGPKPASRIDEVDDQRGEARELGAE